MNVRIIGITGGSGSGKSTVVARLKKEYPEAIVVSMDNYYKPSGIRIGNDNITAHNYDHPEAFDVPLLLENLRQLKSGQSCDMPRYDFVTHDRLKETIHLEPSRLILLDGLMILYEKSIREMLDLKLYVDCPADIRFIRRLQRDISERGRTLESVIEQYTKVVRPGHMNFIEPTKEYADLIIPEGGHNEKAMGVLLSYVKNILNS